MTKIRKGFTLVELLIVIVIIGVLASAMMLASGSATDSAEASTIISDLRSLKSASLMFYAESMDGTPLISEFAKYADNPDKFSTGYDFDNTNANGKWMICYKGGKLTPGVASKLAGKSKSIGLYASADPNSNNYFGDTTSKDEVWMIAR
jgi:general secretion pathway protein G